MNTKTGVIAIAWIVLGLALAFLFGRDLLKLGMDAFREFGPLLGVLAAFIYAGSCMYLGMSILASRKVRTLGQVVAYLLAAASFLYFGLNMFMFLRTQLSVSALACFVGLVGLAFCWTTIKEVRA